MKTPTKYTFRALGLALVMAAAYLPLAQAQTPDWQSVSNSVKHMEKSGGKKLVIASANIKTGVSLERLTLFTGEGNTGKVALGMAKALGGSLIGMKNVDMAEREPIEEHLKQEDAEKIATEALESLMERMKSVGFEVQGPKVVVDAPSYGEVKGEVKTTTTVDTKEGSLFKKGYYYGVYQTPVAGMKFRNLTGVSGALNQATSGTIYRNALLAAGTPGAIDVTMGFVNDKSIFAMTEFTIKVWGFTKGGSSVAPLFTAVLKNVDAFSVPSGAKDTLAYWAALKPKVEVLFDDMSMRFAKAYSEE